MLSSPAPANTADVILAPLVDESAAAREKSARVGKIVGALRRYWLETAGVVLILLVGFALRVIPYCGVGDRLTPDEHYYIADVSILKIIDPSQYPVLVADYIKTEQRQDIVILPPTRANYILSGWAWDAVFHMGVRLSLRAVSAVYSCLTLLLAAWFAYRLGGIRQALAVGAMMAVAPMELVMAHRELIDGVFGFWALLTVWLLWENLQRAPRLGWLAAYAGSIAFLVLTKENSFFVAVALGGMICTAAAFPKLGLGKPNWWLVATTGLGGILGVLVLISLAGGVGPLIESYRLLVTKAEHMDFAYQSGGGPWYRYIVDLMLVSPFVMLPAIGGIFALKREDRAGIYLLLFVAFSCAVMVNVRNGMNVRYATMWDMPLRFLAAGTILRIAAGWAGGLARRQLLFTVALVGIVCAAEFYQYHVIFQVHDVEDPITLYLMYALQIVRR